MAMDAKKTCENKPAATSTKIAINFEGKHIDVTHWTSSHPGGAKILKIFHNREVTAQVHATHSKQAIQQIRARADKTLIEVPGPCAVDQQYIQMRDHYEKLGYFKVDSWVILENILKCAVVILPFFYSLYNIILDVTPVKNTILIAWAMYYAGWVGHDYSHHQWAPNNNTQDAYFCDLLACFMGAWIRGNGVLWWKRRHNTHHVVTNEVHNDPDIVTAPLLCFFETKLAWFNQFQHIYYLPLLSLLHFYWHIEAWITTIIHFLAKRNKRESQLAYYDIFGHIFWDTVFLFWGIQQGAVYPLVAIWVAGTGTAAVVFATHYAEERLEATHNLSFIEQTNRTSRNIKGFFGEQYFWNIITNNLSLQKEHHMFPRMPNVYLRKIQPEVQAFVESQGWDYTQDNIIQCAINAMTLLKANAVTNFSHL